jgi:hypothetical protein
MILLEFSIGFCMNSGWLVDIILARCFKFIAQAQLHDDNDFSLFPRQLFLRKSAEKERRQGVLRQRWSIGH